MTSETVQDFLGDKYSPKSDHWLRQQFEWEQDPARQHYLAFVREVATGQGAGDVLDWDCGTGWAGLELAGWRFKPTFAGDKGKDVEFLKWRLKQHGLSYKVYDLDSAPRLGLAVSFDSLLKYKDPRAAIERLARAGGVVIFNLNTNWPVIQGSTYRADVPGLIEQIKNEFSIISYKIYDHYAHLFAIQGIERKESVKDGE